MKHTLVVYGKFFSKVAKSTEEVVVGSIGKLENEENTNVSITVRPAAVSAPHGDVKKRMPISPDRPPSSPLHSRLSQNLNILSPQSSIQEAWTSAPKKDAIWVVDAQEFAAALLNDIESRTYFFDKCLELESDPLFSQDFSTNVQPKHKNSRLVSEIDAVSDFGGNANASNAIKTHFGICRKIEKTTF